MVYEVRTNNWLDGQLTVLFATGLPELYSSYAFGSEADTVALCIEKTAEEIEKTANGNGTHGGMWHVTCEFATNQIPKNENPLLDPLIWSLGFDQYQKVIERDQDGKPIVNTVGDLFTDPPYTQEDVRPVLRVVRNESYIDPSFIEDMTNAVNTSSWLGGDSGTVKIKSIEPGEPQMRNGTKFWAVKYEFEWKAEGWQPEILNRGFRYKDGSKVVTSANKEAVNLLEDGSLASSDESYYVPYQTYKEIIRHTWLFRN